MSDLPEDSRETLQPSGTTLCDDLSRAAALARELGEPRMADRLERHAERVHRLASIRDPETARDAVFPPLSFVADEIAASTDLLVLSVISNGENTRAWVTALFCQQEGRQIEPYDNPFQELLIERARLAGIIPERTEVSGGR